MENKEWLCFNKNQIYWILYLQHLYRHKEERKESFKVRVEKDIFIVFNTNINVT